MTAGPLVSAVLPTRNRLTYLREAVASVLAQSYARWELIVVDDGSTDGTLDYLADLGDPRVLTVRGAQSGTVAALRNQGISRGRGPLVAFLDSDDLWAPDKLARQVAAQALHPAARWSYTGAEVIGADGAPVAAERWLRDAAPLSGWIARDLITHRARIVCPSVLVERQLLADAGGFDESLPFCEDFDLWLRLASRSEVHALPERLCRVRRHAGNTTSGQSAIFDAMVRVLERHATTQDPAGTAASMRQAQRYRVRLADQLSAEGNTRGAVRALARAAWPPRLRWAWVLARIVARSPGAGRRSQAPTPGGAPS